MPSKVTVKQRTNIPSYPTHENADLSSIARQYPIIYSSADQSAYHYQIIQYYPAASGKYEKKLISPSWKKYKE